MKKSRFTEAQIIAILQQYESGMKVTDICRDKGITTAAFYSWKRKYGGMDAQQLKELKSLQEENQRLKQMYADLSLDHRILKDIIEKKL
ncbi:transposase [Zunongwangia sp. SCSIO 43204]|uniref:transposase n=1 Tax=Zunongwangia TaxID=417127 RepID=UPI000B8786EF|nr:transposase [Zunongwangia sp. SCSIO 43204]UAB83517.1 transposase [Zunongwangia sp. SCSIO 43204]